MKIRGKCKTWKINVNCIRILDGTFKAGKTERKEKPFFLIYNVECNIFGLAKGILASEKLISHQLVQAV